MPLTGSLIYAKHWLVDRIAHLFNVDSHKQPISEQTRQKIGRGLSITYISVSVAVVVAVVIFVPVYVLRVRKPEQPPITYATFKQSSVVSSPDCMPIMPVMPIMHIIPIMQFLDSAASQQLHCRCNSSFLQRVKL